MAITPVDLIIRELCRQVGDKDYRSYDDFVGHIRRGFVELNLISIQTVKYEFLPLNAYNALDWPCDCVRPVAVAIRRNGKTAMLSIDDAILPSGEYTQVDSVTAAEEEIEQILSGTCVPQYEFQISDNGELYGLGRGYNKVGYVTHDKAGRKSHIKGRFLSSDEFLFIYLSDGISSGLDYVPVETENALRAWALSEYYRTTNPSLSQVETIRYREQVTLLNKVDTAETADSWAEVFNHNVTSSPK